MKDQARKREEVIASPTGGERSTMKDQTGKREEVIANLIERREEIMERALLIAQVLGALEDVPSTVENEEMEEPGEQVGSSNEGGETAVDSDCDPAGIVR